MANKRPKPEEIVTKFRQAEVPHEERKADVIRQIGASELVYCLYGRLFRCRSTLN